MRTPSAMEWNEVTAALTSPGLGENEIPHPAGSSHRGLVFITFFWGALSAFSSAIVDIPQFSLVATLAVVIVFMVLYFRSLIPLTAGFNDIGGLLVWLHVGFAVLSMLLTHPTIFVIRYVLLGVALSMLVCIRDAGQSYYDAARRGLTWAGVLFVLYHIPIAVQGGIFSPSYRLASFTNPNAIGSITAVTALSLMDYAVSQIRSTKRLDLRSMALLAAVLQAFLVIVATKSRTAALATAAGVATFTFMRLKTPGRILSLFAAGFFMIVNMMLTGNVQGILSDLYGLEDRFRGDVWTLTGRVENWQYGIEQLWYPNPVFGAGPGSVPLTIGVVHNALLSNLCEVGIVGTLPLVLLVAVVIFRAFQCRLDRRTHFCTALFASALVQSVSESTFISFGNPGSLLVLLAITGILRPPVPDAISASPEQQENAEINAADGSDDWYTQVPT